MNRNSELRCLIVVEPGLNGVFRHAEALIDYALAETGCKLALAYSSRRSSDALSALVERVKKQGGPTVDLNVDNSPGFADAGAFARLIQLVAAFRPTVIHAHSSKAGALGRALWMAGVDAVQFYTPHAYYGLGQGAGVKSTLFNIVESILGRIGRTINVSASERHFACERLSLPSSALLTVANAVDCTRFFPVDEHERTGMRKRFGLPSGAWVFGTVGRYSQQKDPQTLYQSVAEVLVSDPNAWFAHLGEGEAFDEITEFVKGKPWACRVVRVRYDSRPAAFYQTLDAFVLSSRYEGLPISGIEALATGLPLVFTRCPGCEDFATIGLNGIAWGNVGQPDTLVSSLLGVRSLRADDINHRKVAEERFSSVIVYSKILTAYRAAVNERTGGVV